MPRLLFEKTGNAIWISHLDLMRVFQRAFKRAELPLTHTQGYNPRPSVSIALPLSVGVESKCELLDFRLDDCEVSTDEIRSRLNDALTAGIHILDVYEEGRKIRELSLLRCLISMEYDEPYPAEAVAQLRKLFKEPSLYVQKKTKNGVQEQDIIPMIRKLEIMEADEKCIQIDALICCQNPTLNPAQIVLSILKYLPQLKPDFYRCSRIEIFDGNENVFR